MKVNLAVTVAMAIWLPWSAFAFVQSDGEPDGALCIDKGGACQDNANACCDAYVCSGPAKRKTCVKPPICLEMGHECDGVTPCCDGGECALNEQEETFECQAATIGSTTLPLREITASKRHSRNLETENTLTTAVEGQSVSNSIGCTTGDPHILTFDGLKYDCHGEGEFVLAKSNYTAREVQVRYEHMSVERALSVGKAVVFRDEGDVPIVQISIAALNTSQGYDMGDNDGCGVVQLFIDGVQRDLSSGSGQDDKVKVTHRGNDVWVKYPISGMSAKVRYHRCRLNVCLTMPDTDDTITGILGTPTQSVEDDWTTLDGTQVPVPTSLVDRLRKPAYDFCTQNFCLRESSRSMFTYAEDGFDFDYFQKCDLPFDSTIEKYAGDNTPQWIADVCKGDLQCIMDLDNGDVSDFEAVRETLQEYASICNPSGGECDESTCCSSQCIDQGGLAGKVCGDEIQCAPEYGSCQTLGCCGSLTCTQVANGDSLCLEQHECMDEWMSCDEKECCEGMMCRPNRFGNQQCRRPHQCSEKYDDCSLVGCCGTMKCLEDAEDGWKHCDDVPECWDVENKDCSEVPCCDGLTCVEDNGRSLCKDLPDFTARGGSCAWVPCDENSEAPLECVEVVDDQGRQDLQCQYETGSARVFVFDDINSNGIQDAGEPGLSGVALRLLHDSSRDHVEGTEDMVTDEAGMCTFTGVPRGVRVRVKSLDPPKGAIRTLNNKGGDDSRDSDLLDDGTCNPFVIKSEDVWTNTALGYRMPADLELTVFNDVNRNGIFDQDEVGIPDVHLRLITSFDSANIFDDNSGGNAHTELKTDAAGLVRFTKVPQSLGIRVKVTRAPPGSIPTVGNVGDNELIDSDLRSDGTSYGFKLKTGGVHSKIDLGYCLPETVTVRVWDDANVNGVFDDGEAPLSNVSLRLVYDKTGENLVDYLNGTDSSSDSDSGGDNSVSEQGNAHQEIQTDSAGVATFTKVPLGEQIRVKVTGGAPKGASHTQSSLRSGRKSLSDLESSGSSRSFAVASSGSQINLGYSLPGSMTVRVWEDNGGNGIIDGADKGIEGVRLRLVIDETLEPLSAFMSDGNANTEISTNEDGYATFNEVPTGMSLRVKVLNAPDGAVRTLENVAGDSVLGSNGYSDHFVLMQNSVTEIRLGYQLPHNVVVRVWDDKNKNGVQDRDEVGLGGARLRIVNENDSSYYEGQCGEYNATSARQDTKSIGLCNEELTTDGDGLVEFRNVPRGKFRVKVLNKPANVKRTSQNRGDSETNDSDFGDDGLSHAFNLATFEGTTFDEIGLGYILPASVDVRVWDDINGNGIQDQHELGIAGVGLRIISAHDGSYAADFDEVLTESDGTASFVGVPTTEHYRVKVTNAPLGAVRTHLNALNDTVDSDLRSDGTTVSFYLGSFDGNEFDKIDIGYQLPKDVQVKVWNDVDGDGYQEEGEEGMSGVIVRLIDSNGSALQNTGEGCTAHLALPTNETGYVTFRRAPKGKEMRFQIMNAHGATATRQNRGSNDAIDSELGSDLTSDSFNLNAFHGTGVYGTMALGLQMPKRVVVRVWNDTNLNGIQDDGEIGIPNVSLQLLTDAGRTTLRSHGGGGTSHEVVATNEFGLVEFTKVPLGLRYRVKVIQGPADGTVTKRNAGSSEQLDSDMNPSGISDSFKLPTGIEELYDALDIGYYFPESARLYVEQSCSVSTSEFTSGLEGERLSLNVTVDIDAGLADVVGPFDAYVEVDTNGAPEISLLVNGEVQSEYEAGSGIIRVDASQVDSLQVQAGENYSGSFALKTRLRIAGVLRSRPVDYSSPIQNTQVQYRPVADALKTPTSIAVREDDAINFGSNLATLCRSLIEDAGIENGNNAEGETIVALEIAVPPDDAQLTYSVSGEFVPLVASDKGGNGTAVVSYHENEGARVFKVTSTLLSDLASSSYSDRKQAETDILDTVATFEVEIGPTHNDLDGDIVVTLSNADVNLGVADVHETSFNPIIIKARADMPGVQTTRETTPIFEDDGQVIPLFIIAFPSDDQDGSEVISAKLTVPVDSYGPVGNIIAVSEVSGVQLKDKGNGVFTCTSSQGLEALNQFLNGNVAFVPRNGWAGQEVVGVSVESKEKASGDQVSKKRATRSDYIEIVVNPVLDGSDVSLKGNAVGIEDTIISVPIAVTARDPDGSETYVMYIESSNLPSGTVLYGAEGRELLPSTDKAQYSLSPADIDSLALLPPLHYSSALPSQGDITLVTVTETREYGVSNPDGTPVFVSMPFDINVKITGVADKPEHRNILIEGLEDEPYDVGAAVAAAGPVNDLLVDRDGSESLSLLLSGLPKGVVPQSSISEGISYLGDGQYQVAQSSVASLKLPPLPEYSGEAPYADISIRVTTQELDGNQANSDWWTVKFAIMPVVDGFGTAWTANTWITEGLNEAGESSISFASIHDKRLIDNDSSETAIEYMLDFSNFIEDAGIQVRITDLSVSSLEEILSTYLDGAFTFDEATETVTVKSDDIANLALQPQLFLDSNQDFSIPVNVLVQDRAVIDGRDITRERLDPGTFNVHILGTADVPTVFASSATGASGQLIPLYLGGEITDTDMRLGRNESESVYYVVQYLNPPTNQPRWILTDSNGNITGSNQGQHAWILEPHHLNGLRLRAYTYNGTGHTMDFKLTSIAVENDGDRATNETLFNVDITQGEGRGEYLPPLAPSVTVGEHNGVEDRVAFFNVLAEPNPQDTTDPVITVVIKGIPDGAEIVGAAYNPSHGVYVARAEDINADLVHITPPKDFSGTMQIPVQAISTNQFALIALSPEIIIDFYIDPVADGAKISMSATPLREDEDVTVSISMTEIDSDGSEEIGSLSYVKLTNIAALNGGYTLVTNSDDDNTVLGTKVVDFYRIPTSEVASLTIQPLEHWHGDISVDLVTTVFEPLDDPDGDHIRLARSSAVFTIVPVADAPIVEVPAVPVNGKEDEWITIGTAMQVALVDNQFANGAEQVSAVLDGIPQDTILSSGSNNGDGSWSIPVDSLNTLALLPPENFSGQMILTLTGITVELSNGYSENSTSKSFTVQVDSVADSFLMVAKNVDLDSYHVDLDLNIRMLGVTHHNNTNELERPPERLSLQFANVPQGLRLWASQGGTITLTQTGGSSNENEVVGQSFNFTGTQAQANALQIIRSGPGFQAPSAAGETDLHIVNITGVTSDSGHILATPVVDSFIIYSHTPDVSTVLGTEQSQVTDVTGTDGNDILTGSSGSSATLNGAGGRDILRGGTGSDTLTGGAGSDMFVWEPADIDAAGVDIITDFTPGVGGDTLQLTGLVTVIGWNDDDNDPIPAPEGLVGNFVKLEPTGDSSTMVFIDVTGSGSVFQPLVQLSNISNLDLATLVSDGNIMI